MPNAKAKTQYISETDLVYKKKRKTERVAIVEGDQWA